MASSSSKDVNSKPSTTSDDSQPVGTSTISLNQNDQPTTVFDHPSETAKTTPSVRETVGEAMHSFSEGINNNLIAARYGVFASIVLLSAYGISNTPLFFRFRTVGEIPASYFFNRRRLYGRIISVDKSHADSALQIYVRHLSPVGQILPKTWFDFFMRASPVASKLTQIRSTQKPEESRSELLRIKIAGVQYPPLAQYRYKPEEFLENLVKERSLVSCQLLARNVPVEQKKIDPHKRKVREAFPDLEDVEENETSVLDNNKLDHQLAVCKLSYRPSYAQLFSTDIAVSLLLAGNAGASSSVSLSHGIDPIETIADSSQRVDDLRKDVKYLETLAQAEYEALGSQKGIWAFEDVRETKSDVLEEIEFQANASIFQKLWRRLRGE